MDEYFALGKDKKKNRVAVLVVPSIRLDNGEPCAPAQPTYNKCLDLDRHTIHNSFPSSVS